MLKYDTVFGRFPKSLDHDQSGIYIDGKHVFTHEKLRKAKRSLNRLISSGHLFTYLDPLLSLDTSLPSTNNRIEGGVNAPLREMLRLHR